MKNSWQTISSKIVYENKWGRKVREDQVIRPDGTQGIFAVFEINPGVYMIPLNDKKEVYLIHQFRYPVRSWSWEFPGGGTDGQDYLEAAKRELKEETGLEAKTWTKLNEFYPSSGSTNEKGVVFVAEDLIQTGEHKQAEEGIKEVKKVSLEKLIEMIKNGEVVDGCVMSCMLIAADYLGIGVK